MAAPKRTKMQREHDLSVITSMYLRRHTQVEIAKEIGVAQSQVAYDLKEIQKRWRNSSLVDIQEAKTRELARIDELEVLYQEGYRRSLQPSVRTHTTRQVYEDAAPIDPTTGKPVVRPTLPSKADVIRQEQGGDPSFLAGVQWCIEQRCKILGLYASTHISVNWRKSVEEQGYDASVIFERIVQAYRAAVNSGGTGEAA